MNLNIPAGGYVLGVGIDVVDIPRIRDISLRQKERFFEKIYTEGEQQYCLAFRNPYPSLAARFAAKEAVSKAFGTGIGKDIGFRDIEVIKGNNQEPLIRFAEHGMRLLERMGASKVCISLSHTDNLATAVALLLR